ncbi:MAG: cytochrome bc complex cytochrome b subunit [Thermoplasmata archaeon]|nr:cytochrome bc complex cytochrome b subunit [Thermoplasmata archaeon]
MFERWFNRTLNRTWGFIEDRAGIPKWALRPQPAFTFKPSYWTGAFVATAFLYQVVSGLLLLFYYQPSVTPTFTSCGQAAGQLSSSPAAWCSTYYIINSVPMGSILVSTHLYGAYAMIFLMIIHFYRGYYLGAYKAPREFSWMVGTLLMLTTFGMGFTGYILPYTQISYNATQVGLVLALRLPSFGTLLGPFILADGTGQGLLSRMFAAHVVLLPLALGALLYAHIALFEAHGIAPPATSDPVQRRRFTEKEDKQGVPFWPHIFFYMTKWALLYLGLLFGIAALWPWQLPTYVGNLAATQSVTEPDWYFLWLFKLVDFQGVTPVIAIGVTNVLVVYVLVLPFLDRSKRTHPRDRPLFVFLGNSLMGFFILLTVWGGLTPGIGIPPDQVALRIAPIFAVNAAVVGWFYYRYQRGYRTRLEARQRALRLPGIYAKDGSRPAAGRPGGASLPTPSAAPAAREG